MVDIFCPQTLKSDLHVVPAHLSAISVQTALIEMYRVVITNNDFSKMNEDVNVKYCFGRRIYKLTTSRINVPPFPVATKHGYAVMVHEEANTRQTEEVSDKINCNTNAFAQCTRYIKQNIFSQAKSIRLDLILTRVNG